MHMNIVNLLLITSKILLWLELQLILNLILNYNIYINLRDKDLKTEEIYKTELSNSENSIPNNAFYSSGQFFFDKAHTFTQNRKFFKCITETYPCIPMFNAIGYVRIGSTIHMKENEVEMMLKFMNNISNG